MKKKFYDIEKHGVTQGLLVKFMTCRKMTRLFLEGWSSKEVYSDGLNFGSIFHGMLEKIYVDVKSKKLTSVPSSKQLKKYSKMVEIQWYKENPKPSRGLIQMIENSFAVAEKTLPLYLDYWKKDDFKKYRWKAVEKEFCHVVKVGKYRIPVRGKRDGDLFKSGYLLFETKTKSMINEVNLLDTLWYEFQNSVYMWAMMKEYGKYPRGCIYNIIRRSCLRQGKSETLKAYADRISEDILKRPDFYFIRYKLEILKSDMKKFEIEFQSLLHDFVNWYTGDSIDYKNTANCITKYGRCWAVPICSEDNYVRFAKRKTVFRELEDM